MSRSSVLREIARERERQTEKHGDQSHVPDGTGGWWGIMQHILTEKWAEAMAETDPKRLRQELIQVAAVAAQWIESIDRRDS